MGLRSSVRQWPALAVVLGLACVMPRLACALTASPDIVALESFYNSTGRAMPAESGWMRGDPCADGWQGVHCDGDGRVVELRLLQQPLAGSLPADLSGLGRLTTLELQEHGSLGGSLEPVCSLPPTMESLRIVGCGIEGAVPACMAAALPSLIQLDLSGNLLTGDIPSEFAGLDELESLLVADNRLTGDLSAAGDMPLLQHLDVSGNTELSGSLAELAPVSTLRIVSLSDTDVFGALDDLAGLSEIVSVEVANTQVSSVTASTLSGWLQLEQLNMSGCDIVFYGHGSLPNDVAEVILRDTTAVSLPEGFFEGVANQTVVDLSGSAFPSRCPAGQQRRNAPGDGGAYCERNQELGLQALYNVTGGLDGTWHTASGGVVSGWDDWAMPCDEFGASTWSGITCGDGGDASRVVGIRLNRHGLQGPVPWGALASISSLTELDLGDNELERGDTFAFGSMEDAVAVWRDLSSLTLRRSGSVGNGIDVPWGALLGKPLRHFSLSGCGFVGTIAGSVLGTFSSLETLSLASNGLTGTLPVEIGNIDSLTSLNLAANSLGDGTGLPWAQLGRLTSLAFFSVQGNHDFGGALDANALAGLTELTSFDVGSTGLTGTVPWQAFAAMPQLTSLGLYSNAFVGQFDFEPLSPLPLVWLDVHNNPQLGGAFDVSQLPPTLEWLELGATGLQAIAGHGTLPAPLKYLKLYGTKVTSLPEGAFDGVLDMEQTVFAVTGFSSPFPPSCPAGQLQRRAPAGGSEYCERNQSLGLAALYSATGGASGQWNISNGWTDEWPSDASPCTGNDGEPWFGVLCGSGELAQRVVELHLNNNGLVGDLEWSSLASVASLTNLSLASNELAGTIPADQAAVHLRLRAIDVSRCDFSGSLDALSALQALEVGVFAFNSFEGLPEEALTCESLQVLDLRSNDLEGSVGAVGALASISTVLLDDNAFTHGLDELVRATMLKHLSVSDNDLRGGIPWRFLALLDSLESLVASGNPLLAANGEIDGSALANMTSLTTLLLDDVGLTGAVPWQSFRGLVELQTVSAQNNGLTGIVDFSPLAELQSLSHLWFSSNALLEGTFDVRDVPPNLHSLRFADTGLFGISGYGSLPATVSEFDIDGTGVFSLPEGFFNDMPASGNQTVALHAAFPPDCPVGQILAVAPSTLDAYCERSQSAGLGAFFNETGGVDAWDSETAQQWQSGSNPCSGNGGAAWTGIVCGGGAMGDRVTEVSLIGEAGVASIAGEIPWPALSGLSELIVLDLRDNDLLSGPITADIGLLSSLTNLLLAHTAISSSLPPEIGYLYELEALDMFGCSSVTGELPATMENLKELRVLNLLEAGFSGTLPDWISGLTALEMLHLENNAQLSGTLPPSWAALTNLQRLVLYDTQVSGTIPSSYGDLSQLQQLRLDNTLIHGTLPAELGRLRNLQQLVVDSTAIEGALPDSFGQLSSLEELSASHCGITSLPADMSGMTRLFDLYAIDNNIESLPSTIGSLKFLRKLVLRSNQLRALPDTVGGLISLTQLDISYNPIDVVPQQIAQMTKLITLRMDATNIRSFPLSVVNGLGNFKVLHLSESHELVTLTGALPPLLFSFALTESGVVALPEGIFDGPHDLAAEYSEIDLSNNGWSSECPPGQLLKTAPLDAGQFCELNQTEGLKEVFASTGGVSGDWLNTTGWSSGQFHLACGAAPWFGVTCGTDDDSGRVVELALTANGLTADQLPFAAIASLSSLKVLRLDDNLLAGTIPRGQLAQLSQLEEINLDTNALYGTVPEDAFGVLSVLRSMSISSQQEPGFTGPLPSSLGRLHSLEVLSLWGHAWEGQIPSSFRDLVGLRELYLQHSSKLLGPLDVLDDMTALQALHVYDCPALNGTLPSLPNHPELVDLYLNGNALTGDIPDYNLPKLIRLYLAHNPLTGSLPSWSAAALPAVRALWISDTTLQGTVPDSLWTLPSLRFLWAQRNPGLRGTIGAAVAQATNLWNLELYDCSLTGRIPAAELMSLDLRGVKLQGNLMSAHVPSGFAAWCASRTESCQYDDIQSAADPTHADALRSVYSAAQHSFAADNATGWSNAESSDPCLDAWSGVICDTNGVVRHLNLPQASIHLQQDVNASDGTAFLPEQVLTLADATELVISAEDCWLWPSKTLFAAQAPDAHTASTIAEFGIETGGRPGYRVVKGADFWTEVHNLSSTGAVEVGKLLLATNYGTLELNDELGALNLVVESSDVWLPGSDTQTTLYGRPIADQIELGVSPPLSVPVVLHQWRVDRRAPDAFFALPPPTRTNSNSVSVAFGCSEEGCAYDYTTDDGSTWIPATLDDPEAPTDGQGSSAFSGLTHLEAAPSRISAPGPATFVLADNPNIGGWQYRLDDVDWAAVGPERSIPSDADDNARRLYRTLSLQHVAAGDHTITFRAMQSGSDVPDIQPIGFAWLVDAAFDLPPLTVTMASRPPSVTPLATVEFEFTASHERAWFEYQLDGGNWNPTLPLTRIGPVAVGAHTLSVRGRSLYSFGEWSEVVAWSWLFEPRGSGVSLSVEKDGMYEIKARATDPAGNTGAPSNPVRWTVDTVAPQLTANATRSPMWPSFTAGASWARPVSISSNESLIVTRDVSVSVVVGLTDGPEASEACTPNCGVACRVGRAVTSSTANATMADAVLCSDTDLISVDASTAELTVNLTTSVAEDGERVVQLVAVDGAGNHDPGPSYLFFILDRTPPVPSAFVPRAHRQLHGVFTVNSTAFDIVAVCDEVVDHGCAFRIDFVEAGAASIVPRPRTKDDDRTTVADIANLSDGVYDLLVYAWDSMGNSAAPATIAIRVDTQPPGATVAAALSDFVSIHPAPATSQETVSLNMSTTNELVEGFVVCVERLRAADGETSPPPASSFEGLPMCSVTDRAETWVPLDAVDGNAVGYSVEHVIGELQTEAVRVSCRGRDTAGNVPASQLDPSEASNWITFEVDRLPPVLTWSSEPLLVTRDLVSAFNVVASELDVTYVLELDGSAPVEFSSESEIVAEVTETDSDGPHTVEIFAVDRVENTAIESLVWTWWVDTTPPAIDSVQAAESVAGVVGQLATPTVATNKSAPVMSVTCIDTPYTGPHTPPVSCSATVDVVDAGSFSVDGQLVSLPRLPDGPHTFTVWTTDAAGNVAPPVYISSVIDTVAPQIQPITAGVLPGFVNSARIAVNLQCVDATMCRVQYRVVGQKLLGCDDSIAASLRRLDTETEDEATEWAEASLMSAVVDGTELLLAEVGVEAVYAALLDSPTPVVFHFSAPLVALADGEQRLELRASDAAGQELEEQVHSRTFIVDTIAPQAPVLVQFPGVTSQLLFTWALRFPGEVVGGPSPAAVRVEFELTGRTTQPWQQLPRSSNVSDLVRIPVEVPSDGRYSMRIRAVDASGNIGATTTHEWEVVTSRPETTVTRSPSESSGVDYALLAFTATSTASSADGLSIQVRLGTDDWGEPNAGCNTTSSSAAVLTCHHNLYDLAVGSYVVNARAVDAAGNADESPAQAQWRVEVCSGTEYEVLDSNGALTCFPCPEGAFCGDDDRKNMTYAAIGALPGWWTSGSTANLYYRCPIPTACLGRDNAGNRSVCAPGHTSILCSLCDVGYFMRFDGCAPCPDSTGAAVGYSLGIGFVLLCVAFCLYKFRKVLPDGLCKVYASGLQILAGASSVFTIPWPSQVAWILDQTRVVMLDMLSITRAGCASDISFYTSFTIMMVGFIGTGMLVTVVVAWRLGLQTRKEEARVLAVLQEQSSDLARLGPTARTQRGKRTRMSGTASSRTLTIKYTAQAMRYQLDWWALFKRIFLFLMLCYPGVCLKLMQVFHCVEVEDTAWLVADMRFECFDAQWGFFAAWSAIMIFVYTVGMPATLTLVLFKYRKKLQRPDVVERYGDARLLYLRRVMFAYTVVLVWPCQPWFCVREVRKSHVVWRAVGAAAEATLDEHPAVPSNWRRTANYVRRGYLLHCIHRTCRRQAVPAPARGLLVAARVAYSVSRRGALQLHSLEMANAMDCS